MATATSATVSPAVTAADDIEDSNVSSPLSEMDDGEAADEDMDQMQIDGDRGQGDNSSVSGDEQNDEQNKEDSDSALSDAGSEANDTEAETERLYDTPRHQRQRDVVVDQFNHGQVYEHTPSKLRSVSRMNRDVDDNESLSGDEGSGASDDESPTKRASTRAANGNDTSQERKRKRSPMADHSESDQPLRKRTGSVGGDDTGADTPANEDDATSTNPHSGNQSGGEDDDEEAQRKKILGRHSSRRKGADTEGDATGTEAEAEAEEPELAEEDDAEQAGPEADAEDEAEAAAKTAEEGKHGQNGYTVSCANSFTAEKKNAAFKDWSHIEEMFGIFRDRLYKERLERIEEEEQTLLGDIPSHPEYLNMKQCLDERLAQKLQEINKEHEFRIRAHERRAVAIRAQVWGQYYQACRERREWTLESLNQQWYEVQSARRSAHSLPDYGLLFPENPTQRVRNAIAYNTEVSTLAGMAKYAGFPAGPELKGASKSEAEADFGAIEQMRRQRHRPSVSTRDEYQTAPFPRLGPAGEKFIKDTPWANPHHSAHKLYHQNPAQQEPRPPAASSAVTASAAGSVVPTPDGAVQTQPPQAMANRFPDTSDMSRAVLNPSHPLKRPDNVNMAPKTATA